MHLCLSIYQVEVEVFSNLLQSRDYLHQSNLNHHQSALSPNFLQFS
uniref:Uncharacterized protein n=1 Tax=Rhizophora mucronata TaxID=61149 RepID=A0A2P2L366_RHIMU